MARLLLLLTLLPSYPLTLFSQQPDSVRVTPNVTVIEVRPVQDPQARPPISPSGAFVRSFLLPGWSQAILGRRLTAGLFMAWEGVTLGMSLKATRELSALEGQPAPDSANIDDKKQEQQDWLILLAFNHLFAGLEGFVSTHLWDFPEDVRLRAVPVTGGGFGFAVRMPVPWR